VRALHALYGSYAHDYGETVKKQCQDMIVEMNEFSVSDEML